MGYVGLPLAIEFGKIRPVKAFDIDKFRILELISGEDTTMEVSSQEIRDTKSIIFTSDLEDLLNCNVFIVTVPTPIEKNNTPNLQPLQNASEMLGKVITRGSLVVFESTVYPGATEEVCIPIIEKKSGLKFNEGFFAGYSPERINPGDKINTLPNIIKITSGSTPQIAHLVDDLYGSIIKAGTYLVSSIKVAEAAKVIENTQRDLNIALVNEFAKIFNKIGIDTEEVLEAAGTKWNFLKFKPGLVGGHCISVDPYYLTHKAKELGYDPEVILSGRRINNGMARYVATELVKAVSNKKILIHNARILILGFTFKGDCPDIRNTKIIDLVEELRTFNMKVDVCDHWADPTDALDCYDISLVSEPETNFYDAIIIAVDHKDFKQWGTKKIRGFGKKNHVLYDLKHVLLKHESDIRL